ncbi:TIGR01459 family HAD-type hydrolase [Frigidibacter sp. MR17.24]|uniref:TIGR01459 family HAD-type hydrolase n=1 Tax=Frigidibacter sp. MR17.24 TaxID=3127345 RepID=UPI00301309FE
MTRILTHLAEIGQDYDALFCDLWGCVHNGIAPWPEAVAALQAYRQGGGRVILLTNAPRPRQFVIAQLDRLGVPRDAWDDVVTSGDAAQDAMFAGAAGRRVWFIGTEKDLGFFDDVPPEHADAAPIERVALSDAQGIVCTGPFDEFNETPEDYRAQLIFAKTKGMKLLCANPDIVVDMGDKRIYCAGAIAELYDRMGGESLYFGKPHHPIYDLARRRMVAAGGPEQARILCIGDGIRTDVRGAVDEGLDVVFVTGGLAAESFGSDVENPDPDLLRDWLKAEDYEGIAFAIGRLR